MRRMPRSASRLLPLLLLALTGVRPAGALNMQQNPGEPTLSAGDLRFHARAVAYRHDAGDARAEFFIRVPYREIKFMPATDHFEGHLRVTVEMTKGGRRVGYQQREARLQSTDAEATVDSLLGEIYTLGIVAPRGKYHFKVAVEDMNVARHGLVYQMKNKKREGDVEGDIDMSDWLFQNPAVSGIEFAWNVQDRTPETPFAKGALEVQPHPSGYYGYFKDVLTAYYEIYDTPPPPEGRSYRVRTMILGAAADTLLESMDSLRVSEGTAWPHTLYADVSTLPSGHYRLRVDVMAPDSETPRSTSQAEFDVLWDVDSWRSDASELFEVTAQSLLTQEQAYQFRQLSRGEKEAKVDELWRTIDPTPDTAENELRRDFRARVAYANAHYTVFDKGMFSDRGRIWIQFGEPDEIQIERLPVADKTLGYVVDGQIPQASKDLLTKPDQGVVDTRPYEIWTYHLRGHEMVPRHRMNEVAAGMKFVFVDEQGYGDYTLRYSSVSGVR